MIDIHTHIIYDVDDGSDTLSESIAILKKAVENGVTDVIFTPHYVDEGEYNLKNIEDRFDILKSKIKDESIPIKVYLGNEVAVYGNIRSILMDSKVNRLAGSRYMLIEFPMSTDVDYVMDTIYEIKLKGLFPVIAHPERCECFRLHPERIKEAVIEGAYIQCNTGSITGYYGHTAQKIVKRLLKEHLVTFFATDTHSIKQTRYDELHKVEIEVEKIVGLYEKNKLFKYNARNILLDKKIDVEVLK